MGDTKTAPCLPLESPRLRGLAVAALFLGACLAAAQSPPSAAAATAGGARYEPEAVLSALAAAYPGRFSEPSFQGGDWTIRLDGSPYRWAGGRLLPEGAAGEGSAYDPQPFYPYPDELPPIRTLTPEERSRFEALAAGRDARPPTRDMSLFDRLWGLSDETSARARMQSLRFLGKSLLVHRDLVEKLAQVEADIRAAAGRDGSVAAWIGGIGEVDGFYWRNIAGTRSLSFHSYGAAIDIIPARTGGKAWYWLDARRSGLAWFELPYERRISVPRAVIEAFERRGFIWGGKWLYWDFVHFEYRPEILALNGRRPSQAE
jgi:hypothetical protein